MQKKKAAISLFCLVMFAGCIAPLEPFKPSGEPNYSLAETAKQTAEVVAEAATGFSEGLTYGGGGVTGLALAIFAATKAVQRRKKKQEAIVAEAKEKSGVGAA